MTQRTWTVEMSESHKINTSYTWQMHTNFRLGGYDSFTHNDKLLWSNDRKLRSVDFSGLNAIAGKATYRNRRRGHAYSYF